MKRLIGKSSENLAQPRYCKCAFKPFAIMSLGFMPGKAAKGDVHKSGYLPVKF